MKTMFTRTPYIPKLDLSKIDFSEEHLKRKHPPKFKECPECHRQFYTTKRTQKFCGTYKCIFLEKRDK